MGADKLPDLKAEMTEELFAMLWSDYCRRVPEAGRTEIALKARSERWIEDHVAFRTLPGTPCDAMVLSKVFESLGYQKMDHYRFHEKRLNAFWMSPPVKPNACAWEVPPKVFISELDVSSFSEPERVQLQKAIETILPGVRPAPQLFQDSKEGFLKAAREALIFDPQKTRLSFQVYNDIRAFSEYAAWTLIYGVCINHFTVSVHLMDGFKALESFNTFLKNELGLVLNSTGGSEIKGSPDVDLEQSATLAAPMKVEFSDGVYQIPYAFVEFAHRFPVPRNADRRLWESYFQGFVEANADRIFSSTDHR